MRAALLVLACLLVSVPSLSAQTTQADDSNLELVLLSRPILIYGAQVEYTAFDHVAPWLSLRYGTHNAACALLFGSDCGSDGLSAMAGARLTAGAWGPVEPYVTLGLGTLFWNDGDIEATGTAHVGLAWLGFEAVRPRIEFGLESHINPWINVGVGFNPF
ncbi:MAG: hypothetical protein ACRELV_05380 [Longimicrobiales bacterium]